MSSRVLIAIGASLALVGGVAAQSPQAQPIESPRATAVSTDAVPAAGEDAQAQLPQCVQQTGSRIRQQDRVGRQLCLPGRTYSNDDLRRTGDANAADALRRLDPSIR